MLLLTTAACGAAITAMSVVVWLCWTRRHLTASARWQIGVMLGGILWCCAILAASLSGMAEVHLLATGVKALGIPVMAVSYYFTVVTLLNPSARVSRARVVLLFSVPAAHLVLLLLPATRHLTTGTLSQTAGEVWWHPPTLFWVQMAYGALVSAGAAATQANAISDTALRHQPIIRSHLLGTTLVGIGGVASILTMLHHGGAWPSEQLEWVSVALIGTAALDVRSLVREQFLSVAPLTRSAVLSELSEGVLVFDRNERLSDFNVAATDMFGENLRLGIRLPTILARLDGSHRLGDVEYVLLHGREVTITQQSMTTDDRVVGHAVFLTDVTEANQYKRELLQANQQLRDHVDTIEALRAELVVQAERDALTGLANRRHLQGRLADLTARGGTTYAIVLMDIDRFKAINDTHGHLVGDEVLVAAASLLLSAVEPTHTLVRYGGEEFLLLMPGAGAQDAAEQAEEVRARLGAATIATSAGTLRITLSAGVAACPEHGTSSDAVLRRADLALYDAKHAGRNQVRLPKAG